MVEMVVMNTLHKRYLIFLRFTKNSVRLVVLKSSWEVTLYIVAPFDHLHWDCLFFRATGFISYLRSLLKFQVIFPTTLKKRMLHSKKYFLLKIYHLTLM